VPTVELARALGYRVLVTDMYPQRPAYAIADLSEVVDITDRDATLAAARRHHIDGVICDSTDVGVPTAAFVAQAMGLPGMGLEVALNCTDKTRLRALTASSGLRHRAIGSVDELPSAVDAVGLPLVIKPSDNQSGRGVQILRSASQATQAFERAMGFSRSGRVLLEQHLAGTEMIVDGFVTDGAVAVLAVAVKTPYADNPTLAKRIHYPLAADLPVPLAQLQRVTQDTMSALGLEQGVFHAEFMSCKDRIVPIDVAARGGGVLIYRQVIPHVSGVDVNRAMIELAMGRKPPITPRADRRCANIEFLRMPVGRFSAVLGVDEASAVEGVAAIVFNVKPGDLVGPIEDKDQRPGYIVALCDSSAAAIQACERAKARLRVCLHGVDEPVDMA
jgi:biotin carboxylase